MGKLYMLISLIREREKERKGKIRNGCTSQKQMQNPKPLDDVIFHCYAPLTLLIAREGEGEARGDLLSDFPGKSFLYYAPLLFILNLNYSLPARWSL